MKVALLSGGSGQRLWPLSNEARPKQFLRLLRDAEGGLESMVQRVWRQLGAAGLDQDAFLAVGEKQMDLVRKQLGEGVRLIREPDRRDTFPAVSLVAAYLHSIACLPEDETVVVLPVDPYVDDRFFHTVRTLPDVLRRTGAELALVGVRPTYPSSKYGYIVPGDEAGRPPDAEALPVAGFKEKPDEKLAEELLAHGALWNCGVFAFRLGYMIGLLAERGYPVRYEELVRQYDLLPAISFDCEVVEKASRVAAVRYDGEWKDLGTWNTLTEEMGVRHVGPGIVCDRSSGSHIINETEQNVVVVGLPDIVVAVSPDGILVTDKAASPRLKELLRELAPSVPMSGERDWGNWRIVDRKVLEDGRRAVTRIVRLEAGRRLGYHLHLASEEVWTVISGTGEYALNGEFAPLSPGVVVKVPAGALHAIRAHTELEWIEYRCGRDADEDDGIRLYDEGDAARAPASAGSAQRRSGAGRG